VRVQIIGKDNGLGLTKDRDILRSVLEPRHDVAFALAASPPRKLSTFDVNIFTELVNPVFFAQARMNLAFLNPEWTLPEFIPHLRRLDMILCKTHDAVACFTGHGKTLYTGFTSPDLFDPSVERSKTFLHVAGGSSAKGTAQVVEAFRNLPDLSLTIIGDTYVPKDVPSNVERLGRVPTDRLKAEMNAHIFHLCPSSYEGFGHYLNEARSVGAVIITTNAAPMNELARPDFAFGAAPSSATTQNLAVHKHVDVESLTTAIQNASKLSKEACLAIGEKARSAYISERDDFVERMNELLP